MWPQLSDRIQHGKCLLGSRLVPGLLVLSLLFISSLSSISSLGAQPAYGQGVLAWPGWEVGSAWSVLTHQKSITGAAGPATAATSEVLWRFSVERELLVDGVAAFAIAVSSQANGRSGECYRLFVNTENRTLIRLEIFPSGWSGKRIVHWFRRSGAGPTVTAYGHVPLSMPIFDRVAADAYRYEHCINGPDGFVREVTQSVDERADHQLVQLACGSIHVTQQWRPGLPWPAHTSMDGGRLIAELVLDSITVPGIGESIDGSPTVRHDGHDGGDGDTGDVNSMDEFGPPHEGRWWPRSATIEMRPWPLKGGGAEPAPSSTANVQTSVLSWSGYWWPMLASDSGQRLWQNDGPLDKYDYYVRERTGSFPSPYATSWEYENHRTTDQKNTWWGHCNGWAAAAILEPEPAVASWVEGIYFRVGDKKGIITEWHNSTLSDGQWGDRYYGPDDDKQDIYPYEFWSVVIEHIVSQDEAIVMDLDCDEEVWNHPIYGYEMAELERYGDEAKFESKVYYANDGVGADFTGTWEKIAKYEFWCTVDNDGDLVPGASSWAGSSYDAHPDFLWHPGTGQSGGGNSALEEQYVHEITQATPSDFAHIEIRHTYRGDLVARLSVGGLTNPDWAATLTDGEGGSVDDLIVDVDLSAASAYLPPSESNPWYLTVADNAEGDQGSIEAFTVTHSGTRYDAGSLPIQIVDEQTAYSSIGSSGPVSLAHIELQHTYRGDLVVKLGTGNPASPDWVTTVSDREGGEADDLTADVPLSGAEAYLPPSSTHPWFLEVSDHEAGDDGSVQVFTITHDASLYSSSDVPVPITDLETSLAEVGPPSTVCTAHIEIRHSWRGDLVVKVGAGDPANPGWVTTVSDREGEDEDDLITDVNLRGADAYLPPSDANSWFLEVSDGEAGDDGTIQVFSITCGTALHTSNSTPVQITDLETNLAQIGSSAPACKAHIEIAHTWRGDLVVVLGVGNPANPSWATTISDREGEEVDDLIRDVDICVAEAYLPPNIWQPWFLQVADGAEGDEGTVEAFTIHYGDSTYASTFTPLQIADNDTCLAYVGREEGEEVVPVQFILHQNRPNPFLPSTTIPFELPTPADVTLRIYDVSGRAVRTLVSGRLTADYHSQAWDGRDDRGRELVSGIYFYRLHTGAGTLTRKMVMLK